MSIPRIGSCLVLVLCLLLTAPLWSSDFFLRGDVDAKGHVDITDPILNLAFQFLGTPRPLCMDAADTDDSGRIDITDPIASLRFQFLGQPAIPFPGTLDCGDDPTDDQLDCERFPICGCLTPEELTDRVVDSFSTLQCVLAPAVEADLLGTHIVVCPPGLRFCTPISPGCPMEYSDVQVSFDFATELGRISLVGQLARLPVELTSVAGTSVCHYDVNFDGVLDVPFASITREDGAREIVAIAPPTVNRDSTTIEVVLSPPNQGAQCVGLLDLQAIFVEPLIATLEPDLAIQAALIGEDLIGLAVCAGSLP